MLYLRPGQLKRLNAVSRIRHVAKSELIRIAIDRLLTELRKNLPIEPIGLDS